MALLVAALAVSAEEVAKATRLVAVVAVTLEVAHPPKTEADLAAVAGRRLASRHSSPSVETPTPALLS
jgi:hypothetical protein